MVRLGDGVRGGAETRVPSGSLLRHGLGDPHASRLLERGRASRRGALQVRDARARRARLLARLGERRGGIRQPLDERDARFLGGALGDARDGSVRVARRGALQVLDAQEKRVALALDVAEGRRRRGLGARILILVSVRVDASRIGRVPAVAVARLVAVKGSGAYARGERIERPALGGARAPTLARLLRGAHSTMFASHRSRNSGETLAKNEERTS